MWFLSFACFNTSISLSHETPQFVPSVLGRAVLCKESSTRSTPFLKRKHCQTNLGGNSMLKGQSGGDRLSESSPTTYDNIVSN